MQRRGADPRARVLLEPPHLATETLVNQEPRSAWADPVQRFDPGLLIRRAELREQSLSIRYAASTPTLYHRHNVIPANCPPVSIYGAHLALRVRHHSRPELPLPRDTLATI